MSITTPLLFDALNRTRNGEDVELFDQMFLGVNLNPGVTGCNPGAPTATCAAVNGTTQRGSQHLRLNTTFRTNLAKGDFEAVANSLNTYNGTGGAAIQPTAWRTRHRASQGQQGLQRSRWKCRRRRACSPSGIVPGELDFGQSPVQQLRICSRTTEAPTTTPCRCRPRCVQRTV